MIQILLRQGTKAQLDSILLASGELGFTTDTKEVFVGDGTAHFLVGGVTVGLIANRPAAGVSGRMYEATDENKTYLDNGTVWKLVGVASLDDVPDGTTYGRVKLTELNNGQVKQVRAVTGAVDVTGDQINTHLNDDTKHRVINDASTSTTELWSSDKINTAKADKVGGATAGNIASLDANGNLLDSGLKLNDAGSATTDLLSANKILNEIDQRLSGLVWQDPQALVLSMMSDASQGGTPPASPTAGDAYVVNTWGGGYVDGEIREWDGSTWVLIGTLAAGTRVIITDTGAAGSFTSEESVIADYDGSTWAFTAPQEGWALLVVGDGSFFENNGYTFSNDVWVQFTGAGQINAGVGLSKTGNTLFVNLGAGIKELATDAVGIDLQANQGLKLTTEDDAGQLAVDYDDSTIGIVSNQLAVKLKALGGVIVDANGVQASVDGSSIVIDGSGQIAIGVLDGGGFV